MSQTDNDEINISLMEKQRKASKPISIDWDSSSCWKIIVSSPEKANAWLPIFLTLRWSLTLFKEECPKKRKSEIVSTSLGTSNKFIGIVEPLLIEKKLVSAESVEQTTDDSESYWK